MGPGPCECGSIGVSTVNSLRVEGLTFVCSTSSVCLEVTIYLLFCNAVLFISSMIDGVENVLVVGLRWSMCREHLGSWTKVVNGC